MVLALLAAAVAVAAIVWALRERDRASRAEFELASAQKHADLVNAQVAQSAAGVAEAILKKNEEAIAGREQLAQARLEAQLAPMAKSLKDFQEHVAKVEKARNEDTGGLRTQIEQMMAAATATRQETLKLTNALKRGAGIQGRWGEQMLRNVLELAGLRPGVDFEEQVHTSDEEGAARPDVVVRLPGNSYFVIDSKVSTTDYEIFLSAQDDVSRAAALKAHCDSMRRHMLQLASKAYWSRFDKPPVSRSPDIVVMFVPLESAYATAVEQYPTLVAEGWERRVAIVSPSAIFPLLRAVFYGWRAEDQAANAREIAAAGRELHKRVSVIAKYAADLGSALAKAMASYNDFVGSLERNVLTQAKRFETLSAQSDRTIAEMPILDASPQEFRKLVASEGHELAALTVQDS